MRAFAAGPEAFAAALKGRVFGVPARRGKYLWLPFEDGDAILAHLGMSGQFRSDPPDAELVPNTRVVFDLSDRTQLRFVDQRMFGGLSLSVGGAGVPAEIAHIARDPFDPDWDLESAARRLRARRSTVKRALLDQRLVSGIGNIYADETLWRVRMHYDQPTGTLRAARATAVLATAREVMRDALDQGGTSFDALYVNTNGESGYFGRSLNVYGRAGLPCPRCGTPIVREAFMNRSSFRCPRCQRRPRTAR